jgi:hypothetical protein
VRADHKSTDLSNEPQLQLFWLSVSCEGWIPKSLQDYVLNSVDVPLLSNKQLQVFASERASSLIEVSPNHVTSECSSGTFCHASGVQDPTPHEAQCGDRKLGRMVTPPLTGPKWTWTQQQFPHLFRIERNCTTGSSYLSFHPCKNISGAHCMHSSVIHDELKSAALQQIWTKA